MDGVFVVMVRGGRIPLNRIGGNSLLNTGFKLPFIYNVEHDGTLLDAVLANFDANQTKL